MMNLRLGKVFTHPQDDQVLLTCLIPDRDEKDSLESVWVQIPEEVKNDFGMFYEHTRGRIAFPSTEELRFLDEMSNRTLDGFKIEPIPRADQGPWYLGKGAYMGVRNTRPIPSLMGWTPPPFSDEENKQWSGTTDISRINFGDFRDSLEE